MLAYIDAHAAEACCHEPQGSESDARVVVMATVKQFGRPRKERASGAAAVAITSMMMAAGAYCSAAESDERRGFPYTAAMEWRQAAELLAGVPAMAEQCWREWERLMRLPRRLAAPLDPRERPDRPMLVPAQLGKFQICASA
jgi:hypothetical protein